MTTLTNSFEGGTSGTTITAANSGGTSGNAFDAVSAGANTTNTFDSAHAAHGSLGYANATGTTSTSAFLEWAASLTGTSITQVWYRAYLYYTANPTVQHRVVSVLNGSTVVGSVLVTTAGKLITTNTAGGTITTSTAAIPLNQWFRIEGYFLTSAGGTTGQVELKLFSTSMDAAAADETDTSAATVSNSTAITRIRFGTSAAASNVVVHWLDDLGVSSTGYIGPAGGGAVPATAAGSLGITGTAAAQAPAATSAALALAGTVPAGAAAATAGPLALAGTASAAAAGAAAGTLGITGTGAAAGPGTTAAGSLALNGTAGPPAAAATAAGNLAISAAAAAAEPAASSGTVALAGTAGAAARVTASGAITLAGSAIVASGTVTIVVVADMQPAQHTTAPPTVVAAQIAALSPAPWCVLIPGDCTNDGDNAGFTGEFANFDSMYGGIKSLLRPVPGNHDWGNVPGSGNLSAYDAYWGPQAHSGASPPHFYSFDTPNGWHIIALDSDQQWVGSLSNPSATYTAVANDLAANAGKPLIAYWHHPRWSDGTNATDPGGTGDTTVVADIWNLLYDYHCDLVLAGHCHSYQRFGKLGKTGSADAAGIREIVTGTGGSGLFALTSTQRSAVSSYQAAAYDQLNSKWFGYLTLTLTPSTYSWAFTSQNAPASEAPGAVLDSGGPVTSNQFAASASGTLAIAGTAAAAAPAAAAGSLGITGTASAAGPVAAAASITLAGAAAAKAAAAAAGSLSLAGTAAAAGPGPTASGSLALAGVAAGRAQAATSAGIVLAGTVAAAAPGAAAGSLALTGAGAPEATVAATGSLGITGTAAGRGPFTYGTAKAAVMAVPQTVAGQMTLARAEAGQMTVPHAEGGQWP